MPTYEYRCNVCGYQFEVVQGIKEPELKTCSECGDGCLERLISRTSFALVGSGWYKDGYGNKGPK